MLYRTISALLIAALVALGWPARATQNELIPPTTGVYTGVQFSNLIGDAFRSLASSNSGASAPAIVNGAGVKGLIWLDTSVTPNLLKYNYDGTNYVIVGALDTASGIWAAPAGGGIGALSSAATTDLGSLPQATKTISGTTTITAFGSSAVVGSRHSLIFTGVGLTLTHNSVTLILPGGASIATAAGDTAEAVYLGSGNWRVISYSRASGQPIATALSVASLAVSGNATVGGTLGVTGNTTLAGTLGIAGNLSVNTNKFTVAASTGNALVAGTFNVTGDVGVGANTVTIVAGNGNLASAGTVSAVNMTASAAVSGATAAGAMLASQAEMETGTATDKLVTAGRQKNHPGAPKAWAHVHADGTLGSGYNVTSSRNSTGNYAVLFSTTNMSGTSYTPVVTTETSSSWATVASLGTTGFTVLVWNTSGLVNSDFHVVIEGDQ